MDVTSPLKVRRLWSNGFMPLSGTLWPSSRRPVPTPQTLPTLLEAKKVIRHPFFSF